MPTRDRPQRRERPKSIPEFFPERHEPERTTFEKAGSAPEFTSRDTGNHRTEARQPERRREIPPPRSVQKEPTDRGTTYGSDFTTLDRAGSRTELEFNPLEGDQRRIELTPQESTKYRTELQYSRDSAPPAREYAPTVASQHREEFTPFETHSRRPERPSRGREHVGPDLFPADRASGGPELTLRDQVSHRPEYAPSRNDEHHGRRREEFSPVHDEQRRREFAPTDMRQARTDFPFERSPESRDFMPSIESSSHRREFVPTSSTRGRGEFTSSDRSVDRRPEVPYEAPRRHPEFPSFETQPHHRDRSHVDHRVPEQRPSSMEHRRYTDEFTAPDSISSGGSHRDTGLEYFGPESAHHSPEFSTSGSPSRRHESVPFDRRPHMTEFTTMHGPQRYPERVPLDDRTRYYASEERGYQPEFSSAPGPHRHHERMPFDSVERPQFFPSEDRGHRPEFVSMTHPQHHSERMPFDSLRPVYSFPADGSGRTVYVAQTVVEHRTEPPTTPAPTTPAPTTPAPTTPAPTTPPTTPTPVSTPRPRIELISPISGSDKRKVISFEIPELSKETLASKDKTEVFELSTVDGKTKLIPIDKERQKVEAVSAERAKHRVVSGSTETVTRKGNSVEKDQVAYSVEEKSGKGTVRSVKRMHSSQRTQGNGVLPNIPGLNLGGGLPQNIGQQNPLGGLLQGAQNPLQNQLPGQLQNQLPGHLQNQLPGQLQNQLQGQLHNPLQNQLHNPLQGGFPQLNQGGLNGGLPGLGHSAFNGNIHGLGQNVHGLGQGTHGLGQNAFGGLGLNQNPFQFGGGGFPFGL